MADDTEVFWSPGDVAKRLGVSPSGLRRLAGVYAQVFGEVPTDSSGTSRRWPSSAVYRLEQARALLAAGQARSIRDALLAIEGGAVPSADAALALEQDGRIVEALGVVAAQLEVLQSSNRELRLEVEALRSELREQDQGRRPLVAYRGDPERRPGDAERVAGASDGITITDWGLGSGRDDGLIVRLARRLERLLRSNS